MPIELTTIESANEKRIAEIERKNELFFSYFAESTNKAKKKEILQERSTFGDYNRNDDKKISAFLASNTKEVENNYKTIVSEFRKEFNDAVKSGAMKVNYVFSTKFANILAKNIVSFNEKTSRFSLETTLLLDFKAITDKVKKEAEEEEATFLTAKKLLLIAIGNELRHNVKVLKFADKLNDSKNNTLLFPISYNFGNNVFLGEFALFVAENYGLVKIDDKEETTKTFDNVINSYKAAVNEKIALRKKSEEMTKEEMGATKNETKKESNRAKVKKAKGESISDDITKGMTPEAKANLEKKVVGNIEYKLSKNGGDIEGALSDYKKGIKNLTAPFMVELYTAIIERLESRIAAAKNETKKESNRAKVKKAKADGMVQQMTASAKVDKAKADGMVQQMTASAE